MRPNKDQIEPNRSQIRTQIKEKCYFLRLDMSKIREMLFSAEKKSPCGVVPQQNKACNHIPEYSRPKSYLKMHMFISNLMKIDVFSINFDKNIDFLGSAAWPEALNKYKFGVLEL